MSTRICRVCDQPYPRGTGCTNQCCEACHRRFCTPGGVTSPGHGLDLRAARAQTICKTCGSPKPADRSCDCFDNHCQ